MQSHPLTARVLEAHGDLWQRHGQLRAGAGGGTLEIPGARLMASGIAAPQWNNADISQPALADVEMLRAWYGERNVPWGVRVPAGEPWPHGRWLFRKRCMVLLPSAFRPAARPEGVDILRATPADLEVYAGIDAAAFEEDDPGPTADWSRPMLDAEDYLLLLASLDGRPVGVGYAIRTSGWAGQAVAVGGIGVLPEARGRGIGAALTSYGVGWGLADGADIAWLNPDSEGAGRIYTRLGFEETGGFDVYVDN